MDTNDWQNKTADQVVKDTLELVDASENGGILLMHSVWPRTCAALPAIIDGIRARNFTLTTCEDYVRDRYGKSLSDLISAP